MPSWSSILIVWGFFFVHNVRAAGKVSCFYNSSAHWRKVLLAKFTYEDLKPALPYCTHLVYGFVGIDQHTYQVKSLDPRLDTESGLNNFQNTVNLKSLNPSIKMLLSVGGFRDPKLQSYFKVLETNNSRKAFIKSLAAMVEENGFDGADLAWQFPTHEETKSESIDDTSVGFVKKHRTTFRYLVEELSAEFKRRKRLLTLTVLPYVKANEFIVFDIIKDCVEHVHLMTYDYKTPWRFPNEADYAAPLYYVENRNENRNIEQTVNWWRKQNVPAEKLLIAIPTFGRTWKIDDRFDGEMKPPVKANGPGACGIRLPDAGILPYYDLCMTVTTEDIGDSFVMMKKGTDEKYHFGSYAYRQPGNYSQGIWVSFEDPESAAEKAKFASRLHLGGVAIVDLSLDDFRAYCYSQNESDVHFPILHAAKCSLVF